MQLLQARATQLVNMLSDRRRSAYADTLFRKSPNVLDPYFWRDVAIALPEYGERLAKLGQDWIGYAQDQGGPPGFPRPPSRSPGSGLRHRIYSGGGGMPSSRGSATATAWRSPRPRCSCAVR